MTGRVVVYQEANLVAQPAHFSLPCLKPLREQLMCCSCFLAEAIAGWEVLAFLKTLFPIVSGFSWRNPTMLASLNRTATSTLLVFLLWRGLPHMSGDTARKVHFSPEKKISGGANIAQMFSTMSRVVLKEYRHDNSVYYYYYCSLHFLVDQPWLTGFSLTCSVKSWSSRSPWLSPRPSWHARSLSTSWKSPGPSFFWCMQHS